MTLHNTHLSSDHRHTLALKEHQTGRIYVGGSKPGPTFNQRAEGQPNMFDLAVNRMMLDQWLMKQH